MVYNKGKKCPHSMLFSLGQQDYIMFDYVYVRVCVRTLCFGDDEKAACGSSGGGGLCWPLLYASAGLRL